MTKYVDKGFFDLVQLIDADSIESMLLYMPREIVSPELTEEHDILVTGAIEFIHADEMADIEIEEFTKGNN